MADRLSQVLRERIVADARGKMTEDWTLGSPGTCLHAALSVVASARDHGVRLVLQAGTAFWRARPGDTHGDTHFGYLWSGADGWTVASMVLPEMHCWAADPERGEVVDITTHQLRETCELANMRWTIGDPPDFIWASSWPGTVYEPHVEAIEVAVKAALELARRKRAMRLDAAVDLAVQMKGGRA